MKLSELLKMLIEQEGLSEEEALRVAAAYVKKDNTTEMEKQGNYSVQGVNNSRYGEETPEQAKARWMQEEMSDPNGLFAGGATAGGVFGDGVIAMDNFDPMAMSRAMNMQANLRQVQIQREMLETLKELRSRPTEAPKKELSDGRGIRRLLGRKKS